MEQIIITVAPTAAVTVEVKGHAGPGCKALSVQIEQALGETIKDENTREFQQEPQQRMRAQHQT